MQITVLSGKEFIIYDVVADNDIVAPVGGGIAIPVNSYASSGLVPVTVVNEQTTITANSSKFYRLNQLVDVTKVNIPGAKVEVRVLDQVVGSSTNGRWIDSEALVLTSIATATASDQRVWLSNMSDTALTVYVRVEIPQF
ncbi:hypothetical protein D3C78_1502210 [compost metagenome]